MIGIIITGHGNFATGIKSALSLVAGGPKNVEYVDFLQEYSTNDLKQKYIETIENLKECDKILALCDLVGGSPFKTIAELSLETNKQIEIIGGANFPMILEITILKDMEENIDILVEKAIQAGKDSILKFELIKKTEEITDGI